MFFSIIVPAHNSALFIRKGLESITQQTFTDYELIIVCDSCDDDTVLIAKEYSNKVFEINASSISVARNTGLENATGQWILFMDDDDWFLHDYVFEMLAERLRKTKEDFLAFSFIFRTQGYSKCGDWIAVWNKAWKRSFIESKPYRFDPNDPTGDVKFVEAVHPRAKKAYWDMPFYYYNYMREGSFSWHQKHS